MSFTRWLHRTFGFPWIERLDAAYLVPGDVLIVHMAPGWHRHELEKLHALLEEVLPDGVRAVVMTGNTTLEIVHTVDPAARPLASGPLAT